jgi:hypothetical protein
VPKADIGGNVFGRNHGTWRTLGDLEAGDTAPPPHAKQAAEIYGGAFRHDPDLITRHAQALSD